MANKKLNHHMYQDKASGVWYFQKRVKGRMYKFSLDTTSVTEARRRRDEYLDEIRVSGCISSNCQAASDEIPEIPRFGEVAKKWAEIKETKLSPSTFNGYRKAMNYYVLPAFGNKAIDSISPLEIDIFVSKLPGSGGYKKNILSPFKSIMKFAEKHGMINKNPMKEIESICLKKSEIHPLSLDEIFVFLQNVGEFYHPLFVFLFFTGVRFGEAAGLKWKRVDFKNRKVNVTRSMIYVGGKAIYKSPKTRSSQRFIKLQDLVINALREQRERTWNKSDDNFVFVNNAGRTIHPHTLNKIFKRVLKKAGLPFNRTLKDTRSSFITNALDNNERMSFIQRQVGHTTTKMIIEHYYNYVPSDDDGNKIKKALEKYQNLTRPKMLCTETN